MAGRIFQNLELGAAPVISRTVLAMRGLSPGQRRRKTPFRVPGIPQVADPAS